MNKTILYQVVHRNDAWHVLKGKAQTSEGRFQSKADAIERGRELAMREEIGQLRIAKMDGSVESESIYGKDPRLIEG